MKYLRLLARQFPNIAAASAEIINLRAILSLPKGSEHFLSDLHGEYEAFSHVLRNASGIVKERLHALFGYALTEAERRKLATLIYYPQEKLGMQGEPAEGWLEKHLYLLVQVARSFAAQYTRSKTRKAMPPAFAYIMEELLLEKEELPSKQAYYRSIIQSIIEIDRGPAFIVALSEFIQRLAVDRLHIIGDVYDRGPGAEKIMDDLLRYHSVDFQWGNHDIVWMGAAAGSWACMANVLRVSLRYNNTDTLEDGYGISLLPLATFALEHYADDDNRKFRPKDVPEGHFAEKDMALKQRMHKAISIIQFKLEEQLVSRRPSFGMAHRLLLHTLRPAEGIVTVEGREYALTDTHFPTFLPHDPCALTPEEAEVMRRIAASFQYSEKLQRHVRFLYEQGSMYLTRNSNLLLHGCVPMADDGGFLDFDDQGTLYAGKALVDRFEVLAREGFFGKKGSAARLYAEDVLWYLWCGSRSPIFGKERMATFERYFIADPAAHAEPKNAYYRLRNSAEHCGRILEAFGLNPVEGRILNGHVPVVVKKGEKPIKADGRLVVIDGGFAKAYQSETGIAGYTLIDDAFGLRLVAHEPFESRERAISAEQDILASETVVLAQTPSMRRIADTDKGLRLERQIEDLKALLQAYRKGVIQERELPGE
jgi:fructose-1,6-bisphosphatase-3